MEEIQEISDLIKNTLDAESVSISSFYTRMVSDIDVIEVYHAEHGLTCTVDQETRDVKLKTKHESSKMCVGYAIVRINNIDKYFQNGYGNFHGGAMVTCMDIISGSVA